MGKLNVKGWLNVSFELMFYSAWNQNFQLYCLQILIGFKGKYYDLLFKKNFSVLDAARKKSKKKKLRRPRGIEKSSGDSDSQTMSEDQDGHDGHHYHHHHHHDGHAHQIKKKEVHYCPV